MTETPQSCGHPGAAPDVPNLGLIRPPLVYLASLVIGALIQLAMPLPLLPRTRTVALGVSVVVVALALFSYSVAKFRVAGTPIPARKPTTVIVRTGPYRFSRNPIYLAFSLLQLGIAIWGQQRVADGHARWRGGTHSPHRHTERRAVLGAEIRCGVLGLQGLCAPLAVSSPTSGWTWTGAGDADDCASLSVRRPLSRSVGRQSCSVSLELPTRKHENGERDEHKVSRIHSGRRTGRVDPV